MILFYSMCVLSALLGCAGSRSDRGIYVVFAVTVLASLAGLRETTVGTDTTYYYHMFENMALGYTDYFKTEPIYYLLAKICIVLFGTPQAVLFVTAALTNGLIVYRLWELRDQYSFSWTFCLYIALVYPQCFNVMRQWLALAIVFFALFYLLNGRMLRFVFFALVATLVHNSAIISFLYIPFLFLYRVRSMRCNYAVSLCFFGASILVVVLGFDALTQRYRYFFTDRIQVAFSFLFLLKMLIFVFYELIARHEPRCRLLGRNGCGNDSRHERKIELAYGLGIAISSIGMVFDQLGRIAIYFTVLELLFSARIVVNNYYSLYFRLLYILIGAYNFVFGISFQGLYGIAPYSCVLF